MNEAPYRSEREGVFDEYDDAEPPPNSPTVDVTKLTIAELRERAMRLGWLADRAEALDELVRRFFTLRDLARSANRGGMAGADGRSTLAGWLTAQPVEPGEECAVCSGQRCDACRGTGRR